MSNFMNLPSAEQFDVQNALLAGIASNIGTGGIKVNNWEDVQRVVRMGLADKIFTVGDQFVTTYKGIEHKVDIIGINHDKPTDARFENSLTLQFHDCVNNSMLSNTQAIAYTENGLPAGLQVMTISGVQYLFTTTQAIPVGGQVYITDRNEDVPLKVTTYAADRVTVLESNLVVTVGTGTNTFTTSEINDSARARYGSNKYVESSLKQWLNSNEDSFVWKANGKFDRPPSAYEVKGFLKSLDADLSAVLGYVDKQVARANIDGGGQDLFSDKVFLLTRKEVYGTDEGIVTGEKAYPYYSQMAASPMDSEVAWRIKNLSMSPRSWWLRSPYVTYSSSPRRVHTSGSVYSGTSAVTAGGVSPACVII